MGGTDFEAWARRNKQAAEKLKKKATDSRGPLKDFSWIKRMQYLDTREFSATWLRLIPLTKNNPWYEWYSCWVTIGTKSDGSPLKRNVISNSRNGEVPVPDVLYYYASEEENPDLLGREQMAITVVDIHNYHMIPKVAKGGKTYHNPRRCKGKGRGGRGGCEMCANDVPTVLGRQVYWSLYPSTYRDILEQLEGLQSRCMNCKSGTLLPVAYACASCGETFASSYEAEISAASEEKFKTTAATCKACKHVAMAKVVYECNERHGKGRDATYSEGCDKPTPYDGPVDPYGVDVRVVFETVGKNKLVRIEDFRPHVELGPELLRPMDLPDFLGKMSLSEQAEVMKRENPFDARAQEMLDKYDPMPRDEEDHDSIAWDAGAGGEDNESLAEDDNIADIDDDDDDDLPY